MNPCEQPAARSQHRMSKTPRKHWQPELTTFFQPLHTLLYDGTLWCLMTYFVWTYGSTLNAFTRQKIFLALPKSFRRYPTLLYHAANKTGIFNLELQMDQLTYCSGWSFRRSFSITPRFRDTHTHHHSLTLTLGPITHSSHPSLVSPYLPLQIILR